MKKLFLLAIVMIAFACTPTSITDDNNEIEWSPRWGELSEHTGGDAHGTGACANGCTGN